MNTILITGTAKIAYIHTNEGTISKVEYNVFIWAQQGNEQIKFVAPLEETLNNHTHLWAKVKNIVSSYFSDATFTHGSYTSFLDHLTSI